METQQTTKRVHPEPRERGSVTDAMVVAIRKLEHPSKEQIHRITGFKPTDDTKGAQHVGSSVRKKID